MRKTIRLIILGSIFTYVITALLVLLIVCLVERNADAVVNSAISQINQVI